MARKQIIAFACVIAGLATVDAAAQDAIKIGMSFAMTGAGFNAAGRQALAGARLYVQQHGDVVAGKKIELIVRDDAGVAKIRAAVGSLLFLAIARGRLPAWCLGSSHGGRCTSGSSQFVCSASR